MLLYPVSFFGHILIILLILGIIFIIIIPYGGPQSAI